MNAVCGDGNVRAGVEQCDQGAANSNTGTAACSTSCTWRSWCGDGVVQTPNSNGQSEQCDGGYWCNNSCQNEGITNAIITANGLISIWSSSGNSSGTTFNDTFRCTITLSKAATSGTTVRFRRVYGVNYSNPTTWTKYRFVGHTASERYCDAWIPAGATTGTGTNVFNHFIPSTPTPTGYARSEFCIDSTSPIQVSANAIDELKYISLSGITFYNANGTVNFNQTYGTSPTLKSTISFCK
jgi:hypothetical protein